MNKPKFVTTTQAAQMMGVSPDVLAVWRHRSTGPAYYRFLRSIRYDLNELEEFIRQSYVTHAGCGKTSKADRIIDSFNRRNKSRPRR